VYVAVPPSELNADKSKALLLLTDVFGLGLVNNKLIADDFAKNGFYTYVVDYLGGDYIEKDAMHSGNFDFMAWLAKHPAETVRGLLDPVMATLKEEGVKEFAATGYCFGGKYTLALAYEHAITVGVVSHPSLLEIPGDLEKLKASRVPVLWNTCETDGQYGPEKQKIGDDILGNGTMEGEGYKRLYYPGCVHGFAVRADQKDEKQKFGREDSFKQTVDWLRAHGF